MRVASHPMVRDLLAIRVRMLVHADGGPERQLAEWTLPQGNPEGNYIRQGETLVVEVLENRREKPR